MPEFNCYTAPNVEIKVTEVDLKCKRISFTMRLDLQQATGKEKIKKKSIKAKNNQKHNNKDVKNSAFADALSKAIK